MSDQKQIHIVKVKENLRGIAAVYYGRQNKKRWKDIYATNKKVIGPNPNRLKVGLKLIIPNVDTVSSTKPATQSANTSLTAATKNSSETPTQPVETIPITAEPLTETAQSVETTSTTAPSNGGNLKHDHKSFGIETLRHLADYYYGDASEHDKISSFWRNKISDSFDPNPESQISEGNVIFIPKPLPEITQSEPLKYEVDQKEIWMQRTKTLRRAVGTASALISNELSLYEEPIDSINDQDAKDIEFQKKQLEVLEAFVKCLLDYVREQIIEFVSSLMTPNWEPSYHHKAPPTYLLRSLLKQASTDLALIQKALVQRTFTGASKELSVTGHMLVLADRLAYRCLKPATFMQDSQNAYRVISFSSETTHIRQIPYDEGIILLSLPMASVDYREGTIISNEAPIDLLAIPHEVGHHIFLKHSELIQCVDEKTDLTIPHILICDDESCTHTDEDIAVQAKYFRWFEEVFSDIYSCFIAGPIAVLGLQVILADAYPGEWLHDDGHHPVPALRAFIATEILRQLSNHESYPATFENTPDLLDENWEAILRRQGIISADQESFNDVTFTFRTDGHGYKGETRPFLFDLDQEELSHHDHVNESAGDIETASITIKALRDGLSEIITFYINVLVEFCDMEGFTPWSVDQASLDNYDQVLRDLVVQVQEDEPLQPSSKIECEIETFVHEHSDITVNKIRSILAKWDHEGPEGNILGG